LAVPELRGLVPAYLLLGPARANGVLVARFHIFPAKPEIGRTSPALRRFPAAFTLAELLIVVALLAVVLTFSLPSLRRLSARSELRTAARQLRVTLLEARLAAIDSGSPAYFRYQPGGGQFEVGRRSSVSSLSHRAGQDPDVTEPDQFDVSTAAGAGATEPQSLPRGVRFAEPLTNRQVPQSADLGEVPGNASWSAPIVFYANGRTRNARIALMNEFYRIQLDVRGLTGTVQISQVERLPPPEATTPEPLPEAGT